MRGWKRISHSNGKQKKAGVVIVISGKIDLKLKKFTRDKEGHYIMIKGSIQEKDITIVNIYAPKIGVPQYIRQTLMAESEEELKSLLMKVKEESEKVGLKLNIHNTNTMASGPITSWEIDGGNSGNSVRLYFGGLQNHCRW